MKVLTLRGADKSGKTTTIKYLRDTHLIRHSTEFIYSGKSDFTAVFEIVIENNKHKIIVTSYGDKQEILSKQLLRVYNSYSKTALRQYNDTIISELDRQGFGLFVCASRTHGETCDFLDNICDGNQQDLKVIKKGKNYDDKEKADAMYNSIIEML